MKKLFILVLFSLSACSMPVRGVHFSGGTDTSAQAQLNAIRAQQHQANFNAMVQADQLQRMENQMFRMNQRQRFPMMMP